MLKIMKILPRLIVLIGAFSMAMGGDLAPKDLTDGIEQNHSLIVSNLTDTPQENSSLPKEQDLKALLKTISFCASIVAPFSAYYSDRNHWVASGAIVCNVLALSHDLLKIKRRAPFGVLSVVSLWGAIPFYTTILSIAYYLGKYSQFKGRMFVPEEDLLELVEKIYTQNMGTTLFPPFYYFLKKVVDGGQQ